MDNLPDQSPVVTPTPAPAVAPAGKTTPPILILAIALIFMLLGVVVGFAVSNWWASRSASGPTQQACTTEAKLCSDGSYVGRSGPDCEFAACPTTTPTPILESQLPQGWQYIANAECGVSVPLPPKTEPYLGKATTNDEGSYWHSELPAKSSDTMYTTQLWTIFKSDSPYGSGYVSGLVQVLCAANPNGLTSETLFEAASARVRGTGASSPEGTITLTKNGTRTIWGKEVVLGTFQGGMYSDTSYYFLATPTHIYQISTLSMSQDSMVKQTTQQIFDLLKFD